MTASPARLPVIAGNWKMNPTGRRAAVELAVAVRDAVAGVPVRTVVHPPAVFLEAVATAIGGSAVEPGRLAVGAQTMHALDAGAYTGEISAPMLAGLAHYVIVGHSERRQYDNETDAAVAAKVAAAVAHGLVPIAAIGERADERRAGMAAAVIERQLRAAISRLERIAGSGLVIAYEPVWAIGTGEAASGEDAQAAAAQIRAI
ncbi:MAG: triose-phosphate isomerase family protein, partial [Candidatus Limnocylindria bacterium]